MTNVRLPSRATAHAMMMVVVVVVVAMVAGGAVVVVMVMIVLWVVEVLWVVLLVVVWGQKTPLQSFGRASPFLGTSAGRGLQWWRSTLTTRRGCLTACAAAA